MGILYSKLKIFQYKDKLDSLAPESSKVAAPLHIRLKPTNACAHNCWYCAYRKENIQLGKDMVARDFIPEEKMLELIDDFAEIGVKAVTFSGGGDPLYYPYLLPALRRLSQAGISFACLTNGAKLEGELARVFSGKGAWVRVSLDGWDDESYSAYRGVPRGEFARVMENLKNFKRMKGACYLGVIIIVDRKNAAHIYEMIKQLRGSGVDSVKVSPCIISNDSKESNAYHEDYFDLVRRQVSRAKDDFAGADFEIFDSYHRQLNTFGKDYGWCPYIQINPVIGADLNVYSCHDKAYNIEEGLLFSLKGGRFKDAWFSDKNNFFRINPMKHCQHHCAVNDKNKMILEYLQMDKGHVMFV
jgi:MoaA/NifB/PqqE/SkfB family radical SAM enzyme